MVETRIIDGKAVAAELRAEIAVEVAALKGQGLTPGLAVVLVGEDPASQVYVRNKGAQTLEAGMASFEHKLPADTPEADLLALVQRLNADARVHGILVQLPLPGHIDSMKVLSTIDPAKDVDGFHVVNAGRLAVGLDALVPCTPLGCIILLKAAQLLLKEDCTVTIAHSRTRDLPAECRTADILIAAVGRPEMVRGDWIKPGATVIDVGINRIAKPDGKTRLVGDVAFAEAQGVAGLITPVPGGVGPMTIACLLQNTLTAAKRQMG
ncbi:MAG: bifunctional methylenetetrahydrofolate dehydrogenase/methenyltetrahydrofolate cyclohydrolase [Azorhizobium sp. 32-67-21]|nr:MAG: bifunctional methylenetetrahydrofolate dehydrogenase/methenyltetrahydrofolate cyclohydrolase [Azorhizobium sp. 32-67-21]